jgi:RHS repeat-associated protein
LIAYGNNVKTEYTYDDETFRLTVLTTTRQAPQFSGDCPQPPPAAWPGCGVQNLHYAYDPVGNITHIQDDAQQTIFFRNRRVEPSNDYTYDGIYRLVAATGREHLGQAPGGGTQPPTPTSPTDAPRVGLLHPGDGNAMGQYLEQYVYDQVGNILAIRHKSTDPNHAGWKRCYQYATDSNRLLSTGKPSDPNNPDSDCPTQYAPTPIYAEPYTYDAHGNMTKMPHLTLMRWNFKDQLSATSRQAINAGTPETTYYIYDAAGQRVRKVTEGQNGAPRNERLYLGGFEIYREYTGGVVNLARETLHLMDDQQRIALIETKTVDNGNPINAPAPAQRYQLSNHLGSASMELDKDGGLISYEEYHPYGTTAFHARSAAEVTLKRYRYTGKERDEESGLYYHGARYYAAWIGIWISCDPKDIRAGMNVYHFVRGNPIVYADPGGLDTMDTVNRNLDRVNRYLSILGGPSTIAARSLSKAISDNIVTYIKEGSDQGNKQLEQNADRLIVSNIPVVGTVAAIKAGAEEAAESIKKAHEASAGGDKLAAAGHYVDAGLAIYETTTIAVGDAVAHAHAPGKIYAKAVDPKSPKFVAPHAAATVAPPTPSSAPVAPKPATPKAALPPQPVAAVAVERPPLLVQVEIKSVGGEGGGWKQLEQPTRSSYGAIGIITEGGGYEGVATYDRVTGKVELKVSQIGAGSASAKAYQIGQFTPSELADLQAKSGGNPSRLGNLIEAPIRKMISDATGQGVLDPGKNASKTGVDWRPQQPPLPFVN